MRIDALKEIFRLPKLKLAVIGHIEWVTFLKVDQLPLAGEISHAKDYFEEAAGGAAVAAVQMAKLGLGLNLRTGIAFLLLLTFILPPLFPDVAWLH